MCFSARQHHWTGLTVPSEKSRAFMSAFGESQRVEHKSETDSGYAVRCLWS
jgi:hypothetical protein